MTTVPAILDSEIRISLDQLPELVIDEIMGELSIPNEEKIRAKKEKIYGWTDLPDEIPLYEINGNTLCIPRGFRDPLTIGLEHHEIQIAWEDQRTSESILQFNPSFQLRPQQGPAAESIIAFEDGIYEAPAGSGKTVTGLEVVRRVRQRHNLIVVNQIDIATQWQLEAAQYVPGIATGIIGEGRWEEAQLTIATLQTLYSRLEELIARGFFDKWGLVCLDECHHQQARTFMEVINRFNSYYRFGLSATPDKTGIFAMAQAVLGDIVHRTTRHELRDYGILARPRVEVVETGFQFDYWPTHTSTPFEHCMKPGCKLSKKKRHFHRNNYQSLKKKLVEDENRNRLIAARVVRECYTLKRRVLVDSSQKNHLRYIREQLIKLGASPNDIYWMTGDESDVERQRIKLEVPQKPCILMSTIAREAVNIPTLDSVHLTFPIKNPGAIRQIVGRVERQYDGKPEPIINDYYDSEVGVLSNQFKSRRWNVYSVERYRVLRDGEEEEVNDRDEDQGVGRDEG